jgi:hypothetical protein
MRSFRRAELRVRTLVGAGFSRPSALIGTIEWPTSAGLLKFLECS